MRKLATLASAVGILAFGWSAPDGVPAAMAAPPRYQYVPLDPAVPTGFAYFDPIAVTQDGSIYGNAFRCNPGGCTSSVAVRRSGGGRIGILRNGFGFDANNAGTVGGYVYTRANPRSRARQAALFSGQALRLIPRQPGEVDSFAYRVTNTGITLVGSTAPTGALSFYLLRRGQVSPLDLSAFLFGGVSDVNDNGQIAGTGYVNPVGYRAFRLQTPAGPPTVLDPQPTEPYSFAQAINHGGKVLGYSFQFSSTERIGVWKGRAFTTYFLEGTPEFPTVSDRLLWNERGLIVITAGVNDLNSYLVPRIGVRLKLADLADRLPPWTSIRSVNDHGDLVGVGGQVQYQPEESFLLRRVDSASAAPLARAAWRPASAAARAARQTAVAQKLLAPGEDTLAAYRTGGHSRLRRP